MVQNSHNDIELNENQIRIKEIAKRAKAKKSALPSKDPIDEVVQLNFWGEPERGAPNNVLRSPLFGVIKRGPRAKVEGDLIASWADTTIYYDGERLDQSDLDVWLTAIHFSREEGLGAKVPVSVYAFLKALGRSNGSSDREWLDRSISRMIKCMVTVKLPKGYYKGSLINEFGVNEETGQCILHINPRLANLFGEFTKQNWEVRRSLKKDLSRWLYGYVQSQRATKTEPHRIGLDRLRELCGSEVSELREFKRNIKTAMTELSSQHIVEAWGFTKNGALEFVRPERKQITG